MSQPETIPKEVGRKCRRRMFGKKHIILYL